MSQPDKTKALSILNDLINDPTCKLRDRIVTGLKGFLKLDYTLDHSPISEEDGEAARAWIRSVLAWATDRKGYSEAVVVAEQLSSKPKSVVRAIELIDEMMQRPDHDPALAFVRRVVNGEFPNVPE